MLSARVIRLCTFSTMTVAKSIPLPTCWFMAEMTEAGMRLPKRSKVRSGLSTKAGLIKSGLKRTSSSFSRYGVA